MRLDDGLEQGGVVPPAGDPQPLLLLPGQLAAVQGREAHVERADDLAAVLEDGRRLRGELQGEQAGVLLQEVKDALQRVQLPRDRVHVQPGLPHIPDEAVEGQRDLGDLVAQRDAVCRDRPFDARRKQKKTPGC